MTWFSSGLWLICVWLVVFLVNSTSGTTEGSGTSGRIDPKNVDIRSFRKHVMTEGQFKKIDQSNDPEKELENWWNSQTQLQGVPLPYTNTIVVVKSIADLKAALVKTTKLKKQDDKDSLFETQATFPQFDITKAKDGTFTLMDTGNRHIGFAAEDKDGKRSVFHYQATYYSGKAGKPFGVLKYYDGSFIPVSGYEMKIPKKTEPYILKSRQPASNKEKSKQSAISSTPGIKSSDQETNQQVDLNDNDSFPSLSGQKKIKNKKQKQPPKNTIVSSHLTSASNTNRGSPGSKNLESANWGTKNKNLQNVPQLNTSPELSNKHSPPQIDNNNSKQIVNEQDSSARAGGKKPKPPRNVKNTHSQNVPERNTNLNAGSSNKQSSVALDNNNNAQVETKGDTSSSPDSSRRGSITSNQQQDTSGTTKGKPSNKKNRNKGNRRNHA